MKTSQKLFLVFFIMLSINSIKAQDSNNPWEIDFGANAVVFYPMANFSNPTFNNYLGGFVNVSKHYNYYGIPVKLHIGRYVAKGFSIGMSASVNKIRKMANLVQEQNYFGFDTDLRYDLNNIIGAINIIKNLEIDPYISTGVGYTAVGSRHNGTLNVAGGINFWLGKSDNIGIEIQTVGKKRLTGTLSSYFQHSLGIAYRLGGKDSDKDGVKDIEDKCPEVSGLKAFKGCPDTDSDGIIDSKDRCPEEYGTKEMNGCPDSDGDGIIDKNDKCPTMAGPIANNGCPWSDKDKDGVLDKDDRCVSVVGPASNNGCPDKDYSFIANLKKYPMVIHFVNNHSSFNPGITSKLDAIVSVMKNFNKTRFSIYGYTDSTGSTKYNLWLSKKRASAAKNYLVNNGISANRIITKGFGKSNPLSSNKTAEGRANNRRVEIKVINK